MNHTYFNGSLGGVGSLGESPPTDTTKNSGPWPWVFGTAAIAGIVYAATRGGSMSNPVDDDGPWPTREEIGAAAQIKPLRHEEGYALFVGNDRVAKASSLEPLTCLAFSRMEKAGKAPSVYLVDDMNVPFSIRELDRDGKTLREWSGYPDWPDMGRA